ncbi:aminoglycoside phosphotransferase family protein [Chitinimonas sp. PSY-7]|uniref:phosphotransferase n=1 Tax=Chitinimonas sp. PSY-7 TaxID=3459088 RepID=UPI00403FCA14
METGKTQLEIDDALVQHLLSAQFPQWAALPIRLVSPGGWDNRTFRLGEHMLLRMPSAADYASQVEKEQQWLPRLAPLLPLPIPVPLAIGKPAAGYPWKWSIYRWLDGDTARSAQIADPHDFATGLAQFLIALQMIDTKGGPPPGPHSFYRGGALTIYDAETRAAIAALKSKIDAAVATEVWEAALKTIWRDPPVWVHGDISPGNLLVKAGKLNAVIDFGQLTVGDPACDLAIAWTFFTGESREAFRTMLPFDPGTWARARAWTLWKCLIIAAGLIDSNDTEAAQPLRIINEVLTDHRVKT